MDTPPPTAEPKPPASRAKQLGWLLLIWSASTVALGLAAYLMRAVMRLIGMSN